MTSQIYLIYYIRLSLQMIRWWYWTVSNRLYINYEKTYYMMITKQSSSALTRKIFRDRHNLYDEVKGKFLAIIMDNKLKLNHHIDYICNKISKTIGIIHRLRYFIHSFILTLLTIISFGVGHITVTYIYLTFFIKELSDSSIINLS